jgi:hypothetical protein
MNEANILIEILKQQRNQALDALAEAFVRINFLEKELSQAKQASEPNA